MKKSKGPWAKIAVVLTAIVLIVTTIGVLKPYRFWALPSEVEAVELKVVQVADISYGTAVKWEQENLRGIQLSIDKCMANQNCPSTTFLRLQRQEQDSIDAIEKFKRDHRALTTKED